MTALQATAALVTLKNLEAAYRPAAEEAERRRILRNAAITDAIEAGCTHQQIAEATGLTRARIGQIKNGGQS